ncbi:MAG TPA: hypothetical protein VFT47_20915 [Vicinamibacterales bacterium]|nr:hypothetical protein [Vicinamibacterales bacterium]
MLNVLLLVVLLCVMAQAQTDLSGKWSETTPSGLNAELDIKATTTTLTGTFSVRARPMTITDGKVTKNTFTFKAALEGQPEGFSGELDGDSIVLWRDRNGKIDALTLKRATTSLTGKWQGQTPNGMSLILDLVQKDQTLTGTVNREGESAPITDGKVSKNTFTFVASLSGTAETIEGTVETDEMKAWLTRQGPERTALLKRVK